MSKDHRKRRMVIWLLVLLTGWVSIHLIQTNWTLRARLNLLLHGYLFCHLEAPDTAHQPTIPTNEVISKLVYKGGTNVGYLDPNGQFVAFTDNAADWDARNARSMLITAALFYSQWLLLASAVIVLLLYSRKAGAMKC